MKNVLITLLLLVAFGAASGRMLQPATQLIVARIALNNKLMGSAVGAGGICPRQYKNFQALERHASATELKKLLHHHNGVVRCYAFWALSHRQDQDLFPYLLSRIGDKSKVATLFGCSPDDEYVTDFMIGHATWRYDETGSWKLNTQQQAILDSALICTPNVLLYAKDDALERVGDKEALYLPIKQLVLRDNNQYALPALAKFRKQEDIALIRANSSRPGAEDYKTFEAIRFFPDSAFLPFVTNSLRQALGKRAHAPWHSLYAALAAYHNDTAFYWLANSLTTTLRPHQKEQVQQAAYCAIRSCTYPGYDALLWTFWDSLTMIDPFVFTHLYQLDAPAALNRIVSTLRRPDRLYYPDPDNFLDTASERLDLTRIMLDTLIHQDKALAASIMRQQIRDTLIRNVGAFIAAAQALKDTSFTAALLDRIRTEPGPSIYNKAALALIAANDEQINQRLVAAARQNPALRSGWRAHNFKELLAEHHILLD